MRDRPIAATGVLAAFCDAGMLSLVDFHLARRVGDLAGEADPLVQLAFALAVRELRLGSVCVDLATAAQELRPEVDGEAGDIDPATLPWPEPAAWVALVARSPAVAGPGDPTGAFRLDGTLLYLDRYWRQERRLADLLRARSAADPGAPVAAPALPDALDEHQRAAIFAALSHTTTVITGGPGTGKTTIVGQLLAALAPAAPRVALCAPTGKAAARLLTAVGGAGGSTWGGTLHRLLGLRPRSAETEYGPENPLPFDVVVVDETSMVSLELMALLLGALSPATRLILLGDPHQLRSVEAGAVLADIESAHDLVRAPGGAIARLVHNYRSGEQINHLADAILAGDAEAARRAIDEGPAVELLPFDGATDPTALATVRDDAREIAEGVRERAARGDGAAANAWLGRHRILCGHREGPFGVAHWARSVRGWLAGQLPGYGFEGRAYVGQPLLIQRNSDLFSNGDTAVVVAQEDGETLLAAVDRPEGLLTVSPALLDDAADLHAMTIHKSQGSQFDRVSVVLPPVSSPLLTRELLYTAVTRAHDAVRLYGSWEALAAAIATPARRASGLAAGAEPR
ncbi:MAG: exodeoxyribonuclease V subunit alpha [Arachnia sp.]